MSERREFLKVASLLPLGAAAEAAPKGAKQDDPANGPGQTLAPDDESVRVALSLRTVQEQKFDNYHLLGQPDTTGNLLGLSRPQNWKSAKQELAKALKDSTRAEDPINEWLKTFEPTFDERAIAIVMNAGRGVHRSVSTPELMYEPQLYESSLRSAAALLDRCLRYRNEMGGFEISGVGAGISYLAFLKLKPLQRNYIIHSNSADLAEIERISQAIASRRFGEAKGIFVDKHHLLGLEAEAAGNSAEARLAGAKDELRTRLLEKQFNIQADAQLMLFTRLITPGTSSNYAERYLRIHALLVEDLTDAFHKLYSASKGIQQALGLSQVTGAEGSRTINVDIPLFNANELLEMWVKDIVPPEEGDQRKRDVLDALVLWTRAVMRELDRRSQYETEFTVSVPLNQPWGKKNAVLVSKADIAAAFNPPAPASPTGKVMFSLSEDALPFGTMPQNIRVVAIGLSVEYSIDDASPPQYESAYPSSQPGDSTPTEGQRNAVRHFEAIKMARLNATIQTPAQTIPTVGTYSRPPVFLSNVRIQGGSGGDLEALLSPDPACRNASPFGNWMVSLDPNILAHFQSDTPLKDDWITGLVLHLRLRGSAS